MRSLPPDEDSFAPTPSEHIHRCDVVVDRNGNRGVVFRIRPLYPEDRDIFHTVRPDGEETWYAAGELTVLHPAIQ